MLGYGCSDAFSLNITPALSERDVKTCSLHFHKITSLNRQIKRHFKYLNTADGADKLDIPWNANRESVKRQVSLYVRCTLGHGRMNNGVTFVSANLAVMTGSASTSEKNKIHSINIRLVGYKEFCPCFKIVCDQLYLYFDRQTDKDRQKTSGTDK